MKRFDIVTLFPEAVEPYAKASILGRAQKAKLIAIRAHQLRSFSKDSHKKVDDTPYGGGAGMVMTVQPIADAVKKIRQKKGTSRVIVTSASGRMFTQADARRLAAYDQLIFICGRYEGIDQRVEDEIADEALSMGNYVLTGGELPALAMSDAVARLVPGVLGNEVTLHEESHGEAGLLEYPQYTKPEVYLLKEGGFFSLKKAKELRVPEVLLSGNHKAIAAWRKEQAEARTKSVSSS